MFSNSLIEYANQLHHQGYIPVPLCKGGKHLDLTAMRYEPIHLHTRRKPMKELVFSAICYQFSQKPPNKNEIKSWFAGFDGNIGIVGGYHGLIVLDFDGDTFYDRWQKNHPDLVARTPVARSPRGYHVYVKTRTPQVTSSMYCGMRRIGHIKSLGGYVAAAPSKLPGEQCYQWLENRSPFDIEPQEIGSVEELGVHPVSSLKKHYDRIRNRGFFEPQ